MVLLFGLLFVALQHCCSAEMYDIVLPQYRPICQNGCLDWAKAGRGDAQNQQIVNDMWHKVPSGNSCGMPALHSGQNEGDTGQMDGDKFIFDSYEGAWCFCAGDDVEPMTAKYCTPPKQVPEQINLQLAAPDVVVVGFVTYEDGDVTSSPPVARVGKGTAGKMSEVTGVSHLYAPPGRNGTVDKDGKYLYPYTMSYVKFSVEPSTEYRYQVKSGGAGAPWSEVFTFRSANLRGETRLATYGDMGHSAHNNMLNMQQDCASGAISALVHMGDHAYDLGFSSDRRGDAYMNAFQPTLTSCIWFPIIGNHEANDGDHYQRYENIAGGLGGGLEGLQVTSSATSALGEHLTKGTFYSMGLHGATPSNTSRYASSTIGLIHLVGLDLNNLDDVQLAWLDTDLAAAAANRASVPWIMVMSHFPIFHSATRAHRGASHAHYVGDEEDLVGTAAAARAKDFTNTGADFVALPPRCAALAPAEAEAEPACRTIGDFEAALGAKLQPLFTKYGVDIYNAGHVHSYEATFPICDFTTGALCDGKQDFIDPKGTVHITEGNGGVPGVGADYAITDCASKGGFCRVTGTGGAYARITAFNATHLRYDHVQNADGNVTDSFTIVTNRH